MGVFCVYGVTEEKAKAKARKNVSNVDANGRIVPIGDYEEALSAETKRIYEQMKPIQVGPEFDAPQFAYEWIAIAEKSIKCRSLRVMRVGEKLDKNGAKEISKATGKPILTWLPYSPEQVFKAA